MKNLIKVCRVCLIAVLCSFVPEWTTVQNIPGKFKIMFPRNPEEREENLETAIGQLKMKSFICDGDKVKGDTVVYGLIQTDYPDSLVNSDSKDGMQEEIFGSAIEGTVSNVHGTLLTKKVISIKGFPGRQARVSFVQGRNILDLRVYLVKNRCYFLQVGYSKGQEENAAVDKFFNSFDLLQ